MTTERGTEAWKQKISAALKGRSISHPRQRKQATCAHPDRKAKGHGLCEACYRHEYYLNHKDKEITKAGAWQRNHQEHHREYNRRWRERHPETDKQYRATRRKELRKQEKRKALTFLWGPFRKWWKKQPPERNRDRQSFAAFKAGYRHALSRGDS